MKDNPDSYSKRAEGHLLAPQFLDEGETSDFAIDLDEKGNVKAIRHRNFPESHLFILSEVLARFSLGKPPLWALGTSLREIENFLRDENHLPAFGLSMPELEELFVPLQMSFVGQCVREKMGSVLVAKLIERARAWETLSLVERNLWAQELALQVGAELVFCDRLSATLTKLPLGLNGSLLEKIFGIALGLSDEEFPVKVVAV